MNCKHCGGTNPPGAKVCEFCGSELEEKEKVYIPIHEYSSPPPAAGTFQTKLNVEGGKAFVLALLSMIFGFVLLRVIFAGVSLSISTRLIRQARREGVAVPGTLNAARVMSVIGISMAALMLVYLIVYLAHNAGSIASSSY